MHTPSPGSFRVSRYVPIAPAAMRTFAKVKSSAMTPRHPSVPNLIEVTFPMLRLAFAPGNSSDQFFVSGCSKLLHDLAYILGMVTRGNENRIACLNHNQVLHSNESNKL